MELTYSFSEEEFLKVCLQNLERKKTTIVEDLYEALSYFLNTPDSILLTNVKQKYHSEYYDDKLSLKEYINAGKLTFPYVHLELNSDKATDLAITEINLPPFILLRGIQYADGVTKKFKIKNIKMKTKSKSSIEFLNVEFTQELLIKLYSQMAIPERLLPSKLEVYEWRQTFYNKMTGDSFICSCFKGALSKDSVSFSSQHKHLTNALENSSFKDSICHICTKTNSDLMYCVKMYGSDFKVKYGAYIIKQSIQEGISEIDAENQIRELKGVAKIGERWVNETLLFNYVHLLFPKFTVEREATPIWLNKQRFDIYIPELNLAVEYQGQQHYVAIGLFGGKEGLKKTKERDREKLRLSKINGVEIIYFSYKDNLTEKLVTNRLKDYLKP